MTVNIVDAIMGMGKTQAAINYINKSPDDVKFIYITPYLDEVERIIQWCPNKNFKQPKKYNDHSPKILSLKDLLNRGENIATTHALFSYFDDEVIDLCYSQGYVLFMDEVAEVVETYSLGKKDLEILLDNYVTVDDKGILRWREELKDYNEEKYLEEKYLCELESLAVYGGTVMMWLFPVKVFKAFREIFILTYMFEAQAQKYYYDFHGIEYNYMYVEGNSIDTYQLTYECINYKPKYDYKELIHVLDDTKLNMIGDADNSLSKSWYSRNKDNSLMKQLKNNTVNFFNNKPIMRNEDGEWTSSKSSNNLWTCFKDYKSLVQGKGYTKGYIPSNLRATNAYRNRLAVAYLINKFFNPLIKNFFEMHNVTVYEDAYALSEMLQFLWRSGIRDGKEIYVYIPSKRMRGLLLWWIDEVMKDVEDEV